MKKVWDVAAVAGSRITRQAVMVIVMMIAARVLSQEHLGAWSLIYIVIQFGVLLSDSGISTFVVCHRTMTSRMFSTAFYLSLMLAVALSVVILIVGIPFAHTFDYQPYVPHLIGASLAIIPLTMNGILLARLRRDHRFHLMFVSDCISSGVLLAGAVTLLLRGSGLWSFILPTIAAGTSGCFVCSIASGIPKIRGTVRHARTILDYSVGVVGFSSVHYWARNADHVLIGKFFGAAPLGVYSLAYRIMMLPMSQVNATAYAVALPYLAPLRQDLPKLRVAMRKVVTLIGMVTTIPMICIWLERDLLVLWFLGDGWQPVAELLLVLAPLAIIQSLISPIGMGFQISGETRKFFAIGLCSTLITLIAFAIGIFLGTLHWVVLCYAIATVAMIPITIGQGMKTIGGRTRDWIQWVAPFFLCVPACWAIDIMSSSFEPSVQRFTVSTVTSLAVCASLYWYAYRTTYRADLVSLGHRLWTPAVTPRP
jgi:PST family polysaccharide transporter